ncbi:ABC transporter permease [Dactylosporangium vinaceum]|uniref:ABC transporter permease n=1 Tax=Dactylosporangium vinaceum TaxID=53362 RepID=A0ABV5MMS0_9ACTN|nr:ABC transporter permease [Dactylosporangium vinaceum]UAB92231.1 ABC transporter permease [Dactylosporangium vinaceum]
MKRFTWPIAVLVVLLITNLIHTHTFLNIEVRDGHLYGSIIDILRSSAPLALVALGMTLVIATGGIDLSVGAVVAIAGAIACLRISDLGDQGSVPGVLAAVGIAIALALVLGVWNGFLVATIGIQPIIATLILMVAGRGLAQLITDGQIITVNSGPYKMIGAGYWLSLPLSVLIAAAVIVLAVVLVRRSALGMLLEAVGGNAEASRLAGIKARWLILGVYVFAAVCSAVAGLMISSNVSSADGNNAGLLIELDAILAVVIGGTSLSGGRFSIAGTVLGAVIIKTLDITIYTVGVPPEVTLLFKAIVVIVLCLAQSPKFRAMFQRRRPIPVAARADEKVQVGA